MAVIRPTFPEDHFTRVPNAWLRDPNLPPAPKAYLAYLLSHAAGYRCSTSQAARDMGVNRSTVTAWNAKLVERGYFLAVDQGRSNGRYEENDYTVTPCTISAPPLPENRAVAPREPARSTVTEKSRTVEPSRKTRHIEEQGEKNTGEEQGTPTESRADEEQQIALVPAPVTAADRKRLLGSLAAEVTREHVEASSGMANYLAVLGVVKRALDVRGDGHNGSAAGAGVPPRYTDERIRKALADLRNAGRPITLQTLHAALESPQSVTSNGYGPRRSEPYRNPPPGSYKIERQSFL